MQISNCYAENGKVKNVGPTNELCQHLKRSVLPAS